MRILITTPHFYPARLGGPANTLYWLSKGLIKENIEVSVVATDDAIDSSKTKLDQWLEVSGIRVRYCSSKNKLPLRVILHAILEMKKCQCVMLSSISFLPNFFIALFACVFGKKLICSPRGELLDSAMKGERLKVYYLALIKALVGSKITFHATSLDEEESIKYYFGNKTKVFVLPNYMEIPKKQEKGSNSNNYLLFMGRINPIKAIDNLILGCSKSKHFINSSLCLKIAGPEQGTYGDELRMLVKKLSLEERIFFLGRVDGDEKYKLYADAYFSCLVSNSENFGNVIIEALSQGTPVIASKGTPWEILNTNKAGYWIDNTPDSIAECIDNILSLSHDDYTMYRNNALRLSETFDINKNTDKWLNAINSI